MPSKKYEVIANAQVSYMDDSRFAGRNDGNCWVVQHRFGCRHSYLGGKDASCKTSPPTLSPGLWAESIIYGSKQAHGSSMLVTHVTAEK